MEDADPINPQRVFFELSQASARRRDPDVRLRLGGRTGMRATCSIRAGHDGVALRATWRRWARACRTRSRPSSRIPTARCIALVGDGAFQMNGMNEMLTIAKYRDRGPTRG